jgi:hypothetical protein
VDSFAARRALFLLSFLLTRRLFRCCSLAVSSPAFFLSAAGIRGSYVGIQSAGFRDFLLKPELLLAITDCGFEHPSEGE